MSLEESVRTLVREEMQRVLREELPALVAALRPAGDPGDQYLSVQKAAEFAEVHPDTIRAWVKEGRISGARAGRELRVLRSALRRFLEAGDSADDRETPEQEAATILARRRSG